MAEYENGSEYSDEWYTPPEIFEQMKETFDLDPCSPGKSHWVPAKEIYTKKDNGLIMPWNGFIFMNPPFSGRNGHLPWLDKFLYHGQGIGLARAYTSSKWFQDYMSKMDGIFFPRGKTKFIKSTGEIGKAPGHGVVFFALGYRACNALKRMNGLYYGS